MKKFAFLLVMSITSLNLAVQAQQVPIPFVWDAAVSAWRGTITDSSQQIIPASVATGTIYIDVVMERVNGTAKMGVEGWTGTNSWSFPSGYSGGSPSSGQFVVVSQPGTYTNIYSNSVIIKVNFLSDPFVKVDGNPVPGKPHLTDWKTSGVIEINATTSVSLEFSPIFVPPIGWTEIWKNGTKILQDQTSYQITSGTSSDNYKFRYHTTGNQLPAKEIEFKVIITPVNIPVTGVTLNKTSTTLLVGGTETLIATVLPTNATNKNVTWSTSDASKVTVNSSGMITGVAVGSATITVTTVDGGYTANCLVQVNPISVTGVTLNKTSTTLLIGGTETLIATVLPTNATNKAVTWSTSDASKVTVNSSGMITGVAVGSATITVTTVDGGYTATCSVQVSSVHVPVTGVTLNYTNWTAKVGDEQLQLIATIIPANATNQNVTWHSTNPSVASVLNGWVTFLSEGSADIIVTTEDGGKTATCHVIVELWVQKYTINASAGPHGSINPSGEITVNQGASQTFTFIPDPNHVIDQVLVDDVPVDSAGSYTFDNVTKDHTIHVTFKYYNSIDEVDPNAVNIYYHSGTIYLKNLQPGTMMQIIDMLGRVVYQTIPTGESISFSERGVYVVRVLHRTSQYTKKIVTY